MADLEELKPCPFCGSVAAPTTANGETWISCISCDASGRMCSRYDAAVAAWNTRAPDPRLEEADQIKARVGDLKAIEELIYWQFYNAPIENARKNLALCLQRYVLGLPLVTPEEEERARLDAMSPEDRASYWRARNESNARNVAP